MENRDALTIFRTIQKCRHQALHTNDCGDCERCQFYHTQEQLDEAVDLAISALEKQEKDRWIPVTERLPKNKKKVLVSYDTEDDKKVDISMFDKYGCLLGVVSAWRPLPEPYTEEES